MTSGKKASKKTKTSVDSRQSKQIEDLKSQVDYFKNEMVSSSNANLERNVNELNEQLIKLVSININLQSKMTELLIKMTDLVRENRELIGLLEESSQEDSAEKSGVSNESIVFELKKIEKNTSETMRSNLELGQYLKRMYTKNLLIKAIGEKMNGMPMPESEEEMKTSEL
jgi:hypothetical protein